MITAICQSCDKQFDYELKPGFPRKYCPECSARKKAEYEAKPQQPEVPKVIPARIDSDFKPTENKHDIVIIRTEKPHSYEVGKAGARHKIYYGDINELKDQIRMLKAEGLVESREPFEEAFE